MAQDVNKHLERARRSLERNKLREAVTGYQAVLDEVPSHQEALQALADIYSRLNEPSMAAQYYGAQFDRLVDTGDVTKASAIFLRFLRPFPQPPDRLMRYASLLQRQNRIPEAVEQFRVAAGLFQEHNRDIEALACCESITFLDAENPAQHAALGELAERLRHADLASRSFLRAGQLTLATGALDQALEYFDRAYRLAPGDRSCALLFAEAQLRKGSAEGAVTLLEPFASSEKDTPFLALFGEALLRSGRLDRARQAFEAYAKQKGDGFGKLFEVAGAYIRRGEEQKAAQLLIEAKQWMRKARKEGELAAQIGRLADAHPSSLALAEIVASIYEELNRETQYFDALLRLFDLYLAVGRMKEACNALDRLIDIDPYDYRNQERIAKLEGLVDPAFLQNILARAAKAATVASRTDGFSDPASGTVPAAGSVTEEGRTQQALEDLIVQVEIFLQYSLHAKAVERLGRLAELFPGEEDSNERLRSIYERASWWPKGAAQPAAKAVAPAPGGGTARPVAEAPTPEDSHRDLAAIAQINRLMYRQATPREVLSATAEQIGKHLAAARCLIAMGATAEGAQLTAEYFAPGLEAAGPSRISSITSVISRASPNAAGTLELLAATTPLLRELGAECALCMAFTDKESQAPAGALLVGDAAARKWKPSESNFLQAVVDPLVLSVTHSRLRTLVRSLAVADEKTGLLSRGAYIDCLLAESNRAHAHGTPLSLLILQIDHGPELLHKHGDVPVEQYMEQLARALRATIRQTDVAVKYTTWSLVFILPDTSAENARKLADKLRKVATGVHPSWTGGELTLSAIIAEASSRPGSEAEDRVTEWINRAEAGLDTLRQTEGNTVLALATP